MLKYGKIKVDPILVPNVIITKIAVMTAIKDGIHIAIRVGLRIFCELEMKGTNIMIIMDSPRNDAFTNEPFKIDIAPELLIQV